MASSQAKICAGKKPYYGKKQARLALLKCWTARSEVRRERSFYRCPVCNNYHLTSELPNEKKRNQT